MTESSEGADHGIHSAKQNKRTGVLQTFQDLAFKNVEHSKAGQIKMGPKHLSKPSFLYWYDDKDNFGSESI